MTPVDYKYHSTIDLSFKTREAAKWIFSSIYPDIHKVVTNEFKVNLTIEGETLHFEIYATSLGRFRGVYNTLLRLLEMLEKLDRVT
jgi:tRNA threonylcarbamoyladenosine modification (KEOPS) complex  Pcc1 subunit